MEIMGKNSQIDEKDPSMRTFSCGHTSTTRLFVLVLVAGHSETPPPSVIGLFESTAGICFFRVAVHLQ